MGSLNLCRCKIFALMFEDYFHLFYRSLKCVRNNIHTHLMIAILLRASSWICLALINTTMLVSLETKRNSFNFHMFSMFLQ
ncbi:unnamed protein product [Schistosoma curassoni]|uniref:Ovule protein n=1 Tax=Schistosoma curassoni TaxID=6186 RepID=A0A183K524_9TREM|nr:unnamed protein product [Schistosoma curassoni]